MRVHHLQHVPFEGLGCIEPILKAKGYHLSSTHLYDKQTLPPIDDIDWLIVMGGPMGINDKESFPWLLQEKQFIKEAIDSGKIVLGICLGAQLVAEILEAKVYKNKYREIGWFKINRKSEVNNTILSNVILEQTEVFHWHGYTFDIPKGATALAESEACKNQGFIFHNRVIALQFHLEITIESATLLIENCRNEIDDSQYVQSAEEMLSNTQRFSNINQIMHSVLDVLGSDNI